jgi:uncharacterized membrane protein
MSPRLVKMWDTMKTSLWFLPVLFMSVGLVLGLLLPAVDRHWPGLNQALGAHWLSTYIPSTPDSSREVLIGMGAALVTVMAVAASVTMVTVQLASSQYTPRLLRRFMADQITQRVLGAYLLTVVYLLLLLGFLGTDAKERGATPLPLLSLAVALVLTLLCLLLLPHFLHHAARSVEASNLIASVGKETIRELDRMEFTPDEELGDMRPTFPGEPVRLAAKQTGYIQLVDEPRLLAALPRGVRTVRFEVRTGDFVFPGLPLLSLWPRVALSERQQKRLHAAFAVGSSRTTKQDALYAVRQLVDMALKALSPAINDVTTALMVVNELGAVGRAVALKGELGKGWWVRRRGDVTLLRSGFGLVPFLEDAFGEIPLAATQQPRVLIRVLEVLAQLASVEEQDALRVALVQCGRAVYEAAKLAEVRERDLLLIEERWLALQREAAHPCTPPIPPIQ